jgi:hypothetical protein
MAAVALLGAVFCAGQTRPVPAHQREVAPKPKPQASTPVKSDAAIEAAIRAKFAKSKIAVEKFQVHVQGGVATIEGRTEVVQHKGVATRLAKSAGALAVNNHVHPSDAAKQKASASLETGRRRAQVKRGDARSDGPPPRQSR